MSRYRELTAKPRYRELTAKVDEFFARVAARHGDAMQCASGCSDCCRVRLSITQIEATAIADELAAWPVERRRELAEAARAAPADRCAALDPQGRCRIYAARPVVCRSHGVPIRMRDHRSLPVIESCFRNFTTATPDPDCVLDQTTLSTTLYAIDREAGGGPRVDLAALLASC
jgi:hypothetical protein